MSHALVINKNHYVNNYTYTVPLQSNTNLDDYECAIGSSFIYYSWYSISSKLNNNSFQLVIPTAGTTTTLSLIIPDGAYNIDTLNTWLEKQLVTNNYYLRYSGDASNVTTGAVRQANIYPCKFQVNPATYSIQFISISLPRTADLIAPNYNGYVANWTLPTSANKSTQLIVSSSNSFGSIIGYAAGTFGTGTASSTETIESTLIPQVNPISSIEVRLNCLSNKISQNSTLLHIFNNQGKRLGEQITISPIELSFMPCQGQHKYLTIQFFDNNGNFLDLLDNNITLKLVFRKKISA